MEISKWHPAAKILPVRCMVMALASFYFTEDQVQLTRRGKRLATFQEQKGQWFVDAEALVSFMSKISSSHKLDVLNSALLAQLTADKKMVETKTLIKFMYTFWESWLGCS